MKIIIEAEPKEIAALVLAVQERQGTKNGPVRVGECELKKILAKLSAGAEKLDYSQCDLNDYSSAICETVRTLRQCQTF